MTKLEYDIYVTEQKLRMEKGYLTCSERTKLKHMIDNPKEYIKAPESELPKGKPIITSIKELRIPSVPVEKGEDVKSIIKDLKETLAAHPTGLGLSAPQIGIKKQISYIRMPYLSDNKTIEYRETVLINPVITEKANRIRFKQEGCLSFPKLYIDTARYIFITVKYQDENFKEYTEMFQDLNGIAISHEIDHLNGKTIFDRKWKK